MPLPHLRQFNAHCAPEGEDRRQTILLPDCLDDYVAENNPVRVIEAFIDELDLASLPSARRQPCTAGGHQGRSGATGDSPCGCANNSQSAPVPSRPFHRLHATSSPLRGTGRQEANDSRANLALHRTRPSRLSSARVTGISLRQCPPRCYPARGTHSSHRLASL